MQNELDGLIEALLQEMPEYRLQAALWGTEDRFRLFRALVNVRPPREASSSFLQRQDAYLQTLAVDRGITDGERLAFDADGLCVWRGDITTLRCDAIVNAANSAMLGCFCPNHGCIDNAIHTYAGVQLRLCCADIMTKQGYDEPTGRAKLTPAFNLPSRFVLHTVGPIVDNRVTAQDRALLASCYQSCLDLAAQQALRTIAFCCISTGEYHFPSDKAAEIAVMTVRNHDAVKAKRLKVIFNVFKAQDERLYCGLLSHKSTRK